MNTPKLSTKQQDLIIWVWAFLKYHDIDKPISDAKLFRSKLSYISNLNEISLKEYAVIFQFFRTLYLGQDEFLEVLYEFCSIEDLKLKIYNSISVTAQSWIQETREQKIERVRKILLK